MRIGAPHLGTYNRVQECREGVGREALSKEADPGGCPKKHTAGKHGGNAADGELEGSRQLPGEDQGLVLHKPNAERVASIRA